MKKDAMFSIRMTQADADEIVNIGNGSRYNGMKKILEYYGTSRDDELIRLEQENAYLKELLKTYQKLTKVAL